MLLGIGSLLLGGSADDRSFAVCGLGSRSDWLWCCLED